MNLSEESMFAAALEKHDPQERAAFLEQACAGSPGLRQSVESLLSAYDAGQFLEAPAPGLDRTIDVPPVAEKPGTTIGPYKLLEQLGEGGMGVVFLAEQLQPVRRRVALKLIKPGMDSRQVIARFEAERQALALMEHPHIARVFDAGTTASGRPYFVMELVRGIPITDYCDAHQLSLRQRLELFALVCQAVQHAHQKGVIHRDLKPSNVLVAHDDTVPLPKIIDFGIAKATSQPLTEHTLFTAMSQVVGTPLYMSPEQASLNHLDVDTRSDVYALGVLLYELLTGTTPFEPARLRQVGLDEVRRIIREEEPPRPSKRISTLGAALTTVSQRRGVEPRRMRVVLRGELDWIVMKALEKDRQRRYESASSFAADVGRYLNNQAVEAGPPSTAYRLRKFARRNRVALATSALVAAMLLLGGVALGRQWWQEAATAQAVRLDLQEVEALEKQERWAEARQVLERAAGRLASGGPEDLREDVERRRKEVALVARVEEARLLCSTRWTKKGFDFAGADRAYQAAFAGDGLDLEVLGPEEMARRIRGSGIATQLVAALDFWTSVKDELRAESGAALRRVAQLADDDAWRRQLRDPKVRKDPAALERLANSKEVLTQPPANLFLLGGTLGHRKRGSAAKRLLRQAQQRYPADFWINFELAFQLGQEPATRAEAIGFCRVALALRPHSSTVYHNLGTGLLEQGNLAEAEDAFRKAIALQPDRAGTIISLGTTLFDQKKLVEADRAFRQAIALLPDHPMAYFNLGNALRKQGKLAEAEDAYRKAIALQPKDATAYNSVGNALADQNKLADAVEAYRKAIALQPDYATAYYDLGGAFLRLPGKLTEAVEAYRKAIALQPNYPDAFTNLGVALLRQNKLPQAVEAYRQAIALQPDHVNALHNLGNALWKQGKLLEAEGAYRKVIAVRPDHAADYYNLGLALGRQGKAAEAENAYRKVIALQPDYAKAYYELGNALGPQGKLAEAVGAYRKAIALKPDDAAGPYYNLGKVLYEQKQRPEAVRAFRKAIALKPDYAEAYFTLGVALRAQRKLTEAVDAYRKGLEFRPDDADAYYNLGNALRDQKKLPEAEDAFRQAIALQPGDAMAFYNLGNALADQKKLAEAVDAYRKAIALQPNFAKAVNNLGDVLLKQGKLTEAVVACRQAITLQPDYAAAFDNLGSALRKQGKLAEAVDAHRKAIALQPAYAAAFNNLGNALYEQGKLAEAEDAYRKAIALQPDLAGAFTNLGSALDNQQKRAEAVDAYRKAIALQPDDAMAYYNLGVALARQGKLSEAESAYRKAIAHQPDFAVAYTNLGTALWKQKKLAEAVEAHRKAIALQPDNAMAFNNLGLTLFDQKKLVEAVDAYRKAIALQPKYAMAFNNLGNALAVQKKLAEAEDAYRKAIALRPDYAAPFNNLGNALRKQGKLAEAGDACRKAIALQPKYAAAYYNLGLALGQQGKLAEAEDAYRQAIALQPDAADAHYELGLALGRRGKLAEAVDAYRKAIALQPDYAEAHCNLGQVLTQQGKFGEALAARKRGHELGSKNPRWPYPSAQWVRQAERLVELDARLPQILKGDAQPADAAERLELAELCNRKQLYVIAVRFSEEAFAAQPKLAEDLRSAHRYNAACSAALAGCGQGKDAAALNDQERAHLRRQALDWLRADLTAWGKLLEKNPAKVRLLVQNTMRHWQQDADFVGVRGPDALGLLPEAERLAWRRLWEEVETLRKSAAAAP